jgi:anaerobic selenocysteine-containing dehydrogenase
VLVREQLADESAIDQARFSEPTRALVMRAYSPRQVEGQTGIAAERIEGLARELVAVRPSVAVVDEETKDRGAVAAALLLDALLSSVDAPGGVLLPDEEPAGWLAPKLDAVAEAGGRAPAIDGRPAEQRDVEASRILAVPGAITSGKPYPAEVLLLHYSNPIFSKPEGGRWANAIAKVPFVVSFSPIVDESVDFADLVLPDPTYFERWDVWPAGQGVLSLQQPVVASQASSMQTGEVVLRLAASLGGTVAKSLPWKSYRDAVVARLDGLSGGGAEALLDELASNGTYQLARESPESKKEKAASAILDVAPAAVEPVPAIPADPAELALVPFRDRGYAEGGFRQFPWLAELAQTDGSPWTGYVEMAPEDARRLAIADGEMVAVTSPVARVELRARIQTGIMPGVLGLPLGGWGQTVEKLEQMPSRLLTGLADPSTGQWLAWGTTARVEKIG